MGLGSEIMRLAEDLKVVPESVFGFARGTRITLRILAVPCSVSGLVAPTSVRTFLKCSLSCWPRFWSLSSKESKGLFFIRVKPASKRSKLTGADDAGWELPAKVLETRGERIL